MGVGAGGDDAGGGIGGFGGGGGSTNTFFGNAADGGYGGGAAQGTGDGNPGFGGGIYADRAGAGMGGAVFVMEGGSLTFEGNLTVDDNSATAGKAGNGAASSFAGAFGPGFYLQGSGTITFAPEAGKTQTIADAIEDEAGVIANGYVNLSDHPGTGSYGLVINGAGTLLLNNVNHYTGGTTVDAGTLGGSGSIGALTVNVGGTLAPGNSPGIFKTGDLTFTGLTFEVEIAGLTVGTQYDQVQVTGEVSLGGATLDLSLLSFVPAIGASFVIIDNDDTHAVTGQFAQGTKITVGASSFTFNYAGNDGNDVVLTAANFTPDVSDAAASLFEDESITGNVLAGATDSEGDAFSVVAVQGGLDGIVGEQLEGTYGTLTLHANGVYTYVADHLNAAALSTGETQHEIFAFTVKDSAGNTVDKTIDITVNGQDDVIIGTTGNDTLNGTGGRDIVMGDAGNDTINENGGFDVLLGGAGNDIYVLSGGGGLIIEFEGEGTDLVKSSANHFLSENVENLTLTGAAVVGRGNAKANTITGNDQSNILDGGAGIDKLTGGKGDDTYRVDVAGDVVTEMAGAGSGIDLVESVAATYTLSANVENLTLVGNAGISGTGNGLNNVIFGNNGDNTINGGAGDDTLDGGNGGVDVLKISRLFRAASTSAAINSRKWQPRSLPRRPM